MKNGRCRLHGGKSTGARTPAGRRRVQTARFVHGRRTAAVIGLRSAAAAVTRGLAWMAELARKPPLGMGSIARIRIRRWVAGDRRGRSP